MGLSLEEIKRKLIEDVCASCSGGDGQEVGDNTSADEGVDVPDKLVKTLAMLRKIKSKKKSKEDGT
jgi:hypothetical protein